MDDQIDQNPSAHASLEKEALFEWSGQQGQSHGDVAAEEDLNDKPSEAKTHQIPQGHQMDDPLVHSPGVQVPQRQQTNNFGVWGNQYGESSPQKLQSSEPSRSPQSSQTNDPLVQSTGIQIPQRQLTSFIGTWSNQHGRSFPQRPTAVQKPQSAHVEPTRSLQSSQTNDPLVHSTGVQVPQERLSSFTGAWSNQWRNQSGWTSPQHPVATQKTSSFEANPSGRPLTRWISDPLVHRPGVQLPQKKLTSFAGVWINQDGESSPKRPTQNPQSYGPRSSWSQGHNLTSDPLVHNPGVQVPQRQLTSFLGALSNQLGQSFSQHPTATTTQRPKSSGANPYRRWTNLMNNPVIQNPSMLAPQKAHRGHPHQFVTGLQHQQKPQSPGSSVPRQHWLRPPAQTFQESQVTAVKSRPTEQRTEIKQPVTPESVLAVCGDKLLQLNVKLDFLGTGHLIDPADITLGSCTPTGFVESKQELLFETLLHECGATVQLFENKMVYTHFLTYVPRPIGDSPIVKNNDATVRIECHYARFLNVSGNALRPAWTTYHSSRISQQILDFSLRLMTDDWRYERRSSKYFLGDMMNIEASVRVENHVPLRIFVEDCVAAVQPDIHSSTSYVLIEKQGCLSDSKLMASRSKFIPRTQNEKLQMQIEAFRFADETHDSFYITCTLRAVSAVGASESGNKACHYSMENNWWTSADGNDEVCSCCNAERCAIRKARSAEEVNGRLVKLGPITVEEKTTQMDPLRSDYSNVYLL